MLELIKRKKNCLGHWLRRNCLLKDALEGMVNGKKISDERQHYDKWTVSTYKRVKWRMLSSSERPALGQNTMIDLLGTIISFMVLLLVRQEYFLLIEMATIAPFLNQSHKVQFTGGRRGRLAVQE